MTVPGVGRPGGGIVWMTALLVLVSAQSAPSRAETRRLSLGGLQRCLSSGTCPEGYLELGGIDRLRGFVIDEDNDDVILFGDTRPAAVPLRTEDLVVALRNTFHRYARREGDTLIYSPPRCSIDPDPAVFERLEAMMAEASGIGDGGDRARLDAWVKSCRAPQDVAVYGIPRTSRFAEVMVQADYRLKRLVDGTLTPHQTSLESLTDIVTDSLRERIRTTGGPVELRYEPVNRFWFEPGEIVYTMDEGIVELSRLRVVLETEAEHLEEGTLQGRQRADPSARRFADELTAKLPELAEEYPLFGALEALFRHTAVTTALKRQGVEETVLEELLDRFPVSEVSVPETLPGRPALAEFEEPVADSAVLRVTLPSCGGVSIDIDPDDVEVRRAVGPRLRNLRHRVLTSRPSDTAVIW